MLKKLFCAVFVLFLISIVSTSCRADEVTAAMRQADTRLQTRVTIRSPHILIGELLERLSKQSGVTLTADDWSTVGSDSVTVSLHDVPLSDAMNALWSLFSYKHAEWDWRRYPIKGEIGKYNYTLARPDYARFLAERLQEQVQADFEGQAQELIDALNMPPDQLKEAAKNNLLLTGLLEDGSFRPGAEILASLSPETLQNILQNHQGLSLPISELPPQAQQEVAEAQNWVIAAAVKQGYEASALGKAPDHISISISTDASLVTPSLTVETGWGGGCGFGGLYMQDAWLKKMNAQWMQPGDATDDPASSRTLKGFTEMPRAGTNPAYPMADYLLRFAAAAQVPLMARVPQTMETQTTPIILSQTPAQKIAKTFLAAQAAQQGIMLVSKWRGGVLLMTCQNWFIGQSEGARLPWSEVKRLRDAEATGDGFLTLDNIAHAANVLNDAQMTALGEWFPVMANAAQWHDFLAFYDKTPEYHAHVLSVKGDDWQYPENLVNSQLGINALRVTHPNLRLQIQQKQGMAQKPPAHEVMFVVRDDEGAHPINAQGFFWMAHQYDTSLQVSEKADVVVPATGRQSGAAK